MAIGKGKTRVAISVPLDWWRKLCQVAADTDRTPSQLLAGYVDADELRSRLLLPGTPWRPASRKATAAKPGRPPKNPAPAPESSRRRAAPKTRNAR